MYLKNSNIRINGDRIYLRKVELSDVDQEYVDWLNDPDINQFLETRYEIQTNDLIKEYVTNVLNSKSEHLFAICDNSKRHIGNIKLGPINFIHKFAEISLFIGNKNVWGTGIGTEAINILCDYGFSIMELHKITAGCYSNNLGSIKAFKKCGFSEEGIWKDHYLYRGSYVDRVCLARIINKN